MGDIYTNPPQSRNEAILRATIDRTEYEAPPQSRIEDLLIELKEAIEQGACTENYNDLSNKPQIGGVTLEGDKSLKDLSAVATTADQGLTDTEKSNARTNIDTPSNSDIQSSITPPKASVVTVTDAYPINAEDITVDIVPQQDLHGYDKPWPGGAGKNKADIHFALTESYCDSVVHLSAGQYIASLFDQNYTHDGLIGGVNFSCFLMDSNAQNIKAHVQNGVTITAEEASQITTLRYYFDRGQYSGSSNEFFGQLEEGNQATSYAPYSNICPIEGWIGEELDRVGINQWDEEWELGSYSTQTGIKQNSNTNIRSKNKIRIAHNSMYSYSGSLSSESAMIVLWYDKDEEFISWSYGGNKVVTAPANAYFFTFYCGSVYGTTYNNDISINYPSTDTQYHAYQGISRTVNFGQTVYGGKCHATEGGTDVTHANIADYNGETINEPWLSSLDEYTPGATPTTGAQVVYPLATPTTINTNAVDIPMLEGINTISGSTGDVSLKYQPDNVIGELKGMIQEVESEVETEYYGLRVYQDIANPESRVVYTGINKDWSPFSKNSDGTYNLGNWRKMKTLRENRPAMVSRTNDFDYWLDESDYTKKADGITASDVNNSSYDGNAMSYFCPIWMKYISDTDSNGDYLEVRFAYERLDDSYIEVCPERKAIWLPMFYGQVVDSKMRSIAGTKSLGGTTGNTTTDAQKTSISNNGDDYLFLGGKVWDCIKWLMVLWSKSTNTEFWGLGNSNGYVDDSSQDYGTKGNAIVGHGQFYGTADGKSINKFLHSIVFTTQDVWLRDPYVLTVNGVYKVSTDYHYDISGATYVDGGNVPAQGYIKGEKIVSKFGTLASVKGGSTATYYCDYHWIDTSITSVSFVSGRCGVEASGGGFARACDAAAGATWWSDGCALMKKTNAM